MSTDDQSHDAPPTDGKSGGATTEQTASDTRAVQSFYGRWAGLYDLVARWTPKVGTMRTAAAAALSLERGDVVVDMGCGTGANLPYLRERVGPEGTVVGIDVTEPLLKRAQSVVDEHGWDNVHVVRGDATRPPLGGVDAIVASFVVGMFDDPAGVVDDWCDLLVPGGRMSLLNASRSSRRTAAPINALLKVVTIVSTPPTRKLRYERDITGDLVARIEAANEALETRAVETKEQEFLLGLVRLRAGRLPGP